MNTKRIGWVIVFCLLAGVPAFAQRESLFQVLRSATTQEMRRQPAATAIYNARLNANALVNGKSAELTLPIPGDPFAVVVNPVEPRSINLPKGQSAWRGMIGDRAGGMAFFVRGDGWLRGQIERGNKVYQIKSTTRGLVEIRVISPERAFPRDHPQNYRPNDIHISGSAMKGPTPSPDCSDDPLQVDVMVLYTAAARTSAGSTEAMQADVAFAVAQANLAYLNSGVSHRLNLVYTDEVSYSDTAALTFSPLLSSMQNPSDGVLDNVPTLRNSHKADLVSLITENGDACGLGYYLEPPGVASEPYGYSVVLHSCAGGYFSFAHETGHNLAADHDVTNTGTHTSYNFNYGHIQPTPTMASQPAWRTIMSYANPCGSLAGTSCTRLGYFSNPSVSLSGDATGATGASPENNVTALNNAAPFVSKFRCRATGSGANIWMKDTWQDTGGEPDPNTVGQAMWESPYIWVRNDQDTTLTHQHEHQNPIFSHPNWVYVKIHNDGTAAGGGTLELYWASAATNLNDSSNWTSNLIGSQSLPSLAPGTRVVEFPWSSLPGTGHYCLIARWNPSGTTMTFTDVNAAVRASNDLIWHNVDIVPMDPLPDSFSVDMQGVQGGEPTYLVFVGKILAGRNVPWEKTVAANLTIKGAGLERARIESQGVKPLDNANFAMTLGEKPAVIGPFAQNAKQTATLNVRLKTNRELVKSLAEKLDETAVLKLQVIQVRKAGVKPLLAGDGRVFDVPGAVVGGVTYYLKIPSKRGRDITARPPEGVKYR